MKNTIMICLAAVVMAAVATADKLVGGNYFYNDKNGQQSAVVGSSGVLLQVGNTQYMYNPLTDAYDENLGPGTISVTDQGYRYSGTNSSTGVCTFYSNPLPAPL